MGLSENSDDYIFRRHQELCRALNMDSSTTDAAWDSYESIKQHYTLEGDSLHWLGCAIYVACRKATTPTVGQTGAVVSGNCVSLTRLLRLCNFSLTQFFDKSKKWADMANMPGEFRQRIDSLERNFTVSCNVFKKFHIIFNEMFLSPVEEQPRQHRPRKQRNLPCTPARVFEFCWTLFVYVKGEFTTCSDDLVVSFHLLLACCDLAFSNAYLSERTDLLNPSFSDVPSNWGAPSFIKPVTAPCIVNTLCEKFDGLEVEAKWVKEYLWKDAISKLFERDILRGYVKNLSGLFDQGNFDNNLKSINRLYEEHVLNVGEFDEKIFLAEYRRLQIINKQSPFVGIRDALRDLKTDGDLSNTIGSPKNADKDGTEKSQTIRSLSNHYEDQLQRLTPLTGRKYLHNKESRNATPLQSAAQNIVRLQTLLKGRTNDFSLEFKEILKLCAHDPTESMKKQIREMGEMFKNHITSPDLSLHNVNLELANQRLVFSETLYYKLLENVIQDERSRKPNLDVSILLEKDIFNQCMFACSIEIVLCSYNSFKFPWILQALNLKAFYFYRVIELIVRTKDQLPRDVVKHLNSIEEQILESIAWESDSPLWECIEANRPVPTCEDTILAPPSEDPLSNTCVRRIQMSSTLQSPVSTASERFQSPIANSVVKKKLFTEPQTNRVRPGQSLLQNSASQKTMAIVLVDERGARKLIPISEITESPNAPHEVPQVQGKLEKSKRNGSLALFFRKVYNLAGVRMEELCNQLHVVDTELKRKIFTFFEYTLTENTEMMKDRHLDQILMCSVYVVCKMTQNEKSFTEIMRCYRYQPQADSYVYRSVLVKKHKPNENGANGPSNESQSNKTTSDPVPTRRANPGELAGTATSHDSEDRCDIIKFYNTVYIESIKDFVRLFTQPERTDLHLSPLPVTKHLPLVSPKRRVIDNVYVRPYEQSSAPSNAAKQYSYFFSRSPSKNLQEINTVINSHVGKRLLTEDDDELIPPKMTKKLHNLIEDRLGQTKD